MLNGIINVYKEKNFTSFDVVAVMRGITGTRKVGHTGTLDPYAEGVLPVCIGSATALCDMLTDKRKEYVASFLLGKSTDTLDITGTVLEERNPQASVQTLEAAIRSFIGGYDQLPPMYSAKKVDGKRLYDLARAGKEVERKPQFVEIYDIEILSMEYPGFTVRVECGKGTYIRSLGADIAAKCGELAVMTDLKR
ncbi:MAG: tRNA pseudouridine(55) synthase TruB, partial [Lachnospiraceae bacterium]|nr:tRNA pseudouridine(55) synthase TruB [Lachnospiraceae bacterium]